MRRKAKGINAERELIHLLWEQGWAAIRVAGSGSSKYPSPDILTGNGIRSLAIECKSSGKSARYLPKKEIEELVSFSRSFGAEPWVGVRFDKKEWLFLPANNLRETENSFVVQAKGAQLKGLLLEEMIQ